MADRGEGHDTRLHASTRRGDIQGLRALAVVLVVVYHSGVGLPGGFIGVDVFFVISGFVITKILTIELAASGRLDLKRFYLRRIRRLLPALGLMLSIVMLAAVLLAAIGGQQVTARTGAAAALLNANTYLIRFGTGGYFDVSADVNALLHTWSLSVEEQFYLVFPAVLLGTWILGRRFPKLGSARAATITLAGITLVSFALSWSFTNGHTAVFGIADHTREIAFYSAPTRAWQFAVGGLLVFVAPRLITFGKATATVLATAGIALVMFAAIAFDDQTRFPGMAALIPTAGTLLILAAGERSGGNPLSRAFELRPTQYLGDLSYSWYLWHWPCIVFAAALWPTATHSGLYAAAFSLLPAWLAYRLVESPIRFTPQPRTIRTFTLATACVALPLASAIVLEGSRNAVQVGNDFTKYQNSRQPHTDAAAGCSNEIPFGERGDVDCTWEVETQGGEAILLGDSQAGQFSEGFIRAATDSGFDATLTTMPGCPFVDLRLSAPNGDSAPYEACHRFVAASLKHIVQRHPKFVVIASSSEGWIESSRGLADPSIGIFRYSPEQKAELWAEGLARIIRSLTEAGIAVAVLHAIPRVPNFDTRSCAVLRLLTPSDVCSPSVDRDEVDRTRQRAVLAESLAAAEAGAATLDVAGELCPGDRCSTRRDGNWIWTDTHISVYTSTRLAPTLATLFRNR